MKKSELTSITYDPANTINTKEQIPASLLEMSPEAVMLYCTTTLPTTHPSIKPRLVSVIAEYEKTIYKQPIKKKKNDESRKTSKT